MIAGPACAKPAVRARDLLDLPRPPVVLAYGIGVDSTAMLIELVARGETPDLVLTADTGSEKPATYDYLDIIRRGPVALFNAHQARPNDRFHPR